MSTRERYSRREISKSNRFSSAIRSIIETAFFGNNVESVATLREAYKLASSNPRTIVTDMPIYMPEEIGLESEAKIIVVNDGAVHGRCAAARKIIGQPDVDSDVLEAILKEAVYDIQVKGAYKTQSIIGLDKDFCVKAKLLIPRSYDTILYNWLLNFQEVNLFSNKLYTESKQFDEGDILVFSDPDWRHPDYPFGLTMFDMENNCAAILGMRYFGEFKKGTLTLAWAIGNRNGYIACHGGVKRYNLEEKDPVVVGIFGLSGSGKSTLVHSKHDDAFNVSILHDDALLISAETGKSIALEPSYFDKTTDYPLISEDNKYLLSVQNCGVTLDKNGMKVVVCEDIRNSNGRAIKSKLWSLNRVDKIEEKIDVIIWLMKDPTLPPVLKVEDPVLAATMGALLATKRSTAERLSKGMNYDDMVIEPYANPFRIYPLKDDYYKFKKLFVEKGVECYIMNTGYYLKKKVTKEMTLNIIEKIIHKEIECVDWQVMQGTSIYELEGFTPDLNDLYYISYLIASLEQRLFFIQQKRENGQKLDELPDEAYETMKTIVDNLEIRLKAMEAK